MCKSVFFLSCFVLLQTASVVVFADATGSFSQENAKQAAISEAPFKPFTGKILKNKVRMRQQASLESPILKELQQGDLFIVVAEEDDFYAVQPPSNSKAYVFRTYVLDNTVEGSHVNVRLEPDLEAPVIAQLNSGDRVQGKISALNNKWLEIPPPESTRFYVAKEYVQNIGDATLAATIEKRREEVTRLLNSTYLLSQTELQKPYSEVNLDIVFDNLNQVIKSYSEFPEQITAEQLNRAKELLSMTQESYLQKKIFYLETKSQQEQFVAVAQSKEAQKAVENSISNLSVTAHQVQEYMNEASSTESVGWKKSEVGVPNNKMTSWLPVEKTLYEMWAAQNNNRSQEEFYKNQKEHAIALKGVLEPYTRAIKNKPGDFLLISQANHLPIAYLYSTSVNLQEKLGQEVTIYAIPRANNNFAFPAYFVLSVE
jgi:hypothetical protein